ncbi:FAD-binding oxidoreductase [uncultured Clostridium sp.]|uniref:FAD-binding oxidoreductase n=1 Tax=uncultured Clostridium sp. TaxID=59620 RepID=UPI0025F5F39C|nr:FAD-binding oxidoreductase [uncultured Clostridium sp.]
MKYERLKELIDNKKIVFKDEIEEKYLTDGLGIKHGNAEVLVFAENEDDVKKVIDFANENKINVTVRGAGTGLTGATIPIHGGIILDLSRMNKIIELDEENFTITVEPGVLLKDLQSFVEERNYFYPPDPGEKTATIGGNVSTNAGGMRAVKYGVTRDYVRQLQVVTGDGRSITVGSSTIKNSSGLDLKDLIVGSEGTLAVITKIVLKIIPKPEKCISVLIPFNTLKDGINSVTSIIKADSSPTAIEFMERDVASNAEKYLDLKLPYDGGKAFLILTFDGNETSININKEKAKKAVFDNKALDFIELDSKEYEDTWKIRGALCSAVTAGSEQIPIDIVVPITKISDFAESAAYLGKKHNIKVIYFGHAGDGNIHLCVVRGNLDEKSWNERSHNFLVDLYGKSHEFKGIPSGEHGIGLDKRAYFIKYENEENINIMNQIKGVFDKNFILNKNKVY